MLGMAINRLPSREPSGCERIIPGPMLSTLYDARNPKRRRAEGGFPPPTVEQYLWESWGSATLFRASLAALLLLAQPAAAARSEWKRQDQSELRLLLVPGSGPTLRGGVDIGLEPGWH